MRHKVKDLVVITISGDAATGEAKFHGFEVGTTVRITEVFPEHYGAEYLDGSDYWYINDSCCRAVMEETKPLDTQVGGSHYKDMKIQPMEYCHANGIPFPEGNVIKYVSRWRNKNGVEDLKKAKHVLELIIQMEEQKETAHAL